MNIIHIHHNSSNNHPLFSTTSNGSYDARKIQEYLSERHQRYLLFCHAFTGCDTGSALLAMENNSLLQIMMMILLLLPQIIVIIIIIIIITIILFQFLLDTNLVHFFSDYMKRAWMSILLWTSFLTLNPQGR